MDSSENSINANEAPSEVFVGGFDPAESNVSALRASRGKPAMVERGPSPLQAAERQIPNSNRMLWTGVTILAFTFLVAIIGYRLAGWRWVDAVYMVTITIFGVGYGEVQPIDSVPLKLFTIAVIFSGCSSTVYVIGGVIQWITQGEVRKLMGIRQRNKCIDKMQDHTIVCGYGRVGQILASELRSKGRALVVLDRERCRVEQATLDGFNAIMADATDDQALHQAGLLRASALATVLPDDAANVFITLTARDLSNSINIIARAEYPSTERKLIRSGATHVVMPAAIGALRIAQLAAENEERQSSLPDERFRMLKSGLPVGQTGDAQVASVESASLP